MTQKERDSFVYWQEITRNQFSTVSNLILTLATGLLAFYSTFLFEHKFLSTYSFWLAVVGLFLLLGSVFFALWCAINRLLDFRMTTQIVRRREKGEIDLVELRKRSRLLGKFTWRLFWFQTTSFWLGACCGVLAVVIQI